ncbi:MAG: hypothetical protein OXT63_10655 [Gemmatimonadota bacterium]|nr:hypothetical protein [Gemmatimonadota bacterium]
MKRFPMTVAALLVIAAGAACDNSPMEAGERGHDESGEESNVSLTKADVFDQTRGGARLILRWNEAEQAFTGTAENVTSSVIRRVRVEVHLSNGTELGPTTPTDLNAGESISVRLDARGQVFDRWSAHAEVG